MTHIAYVVSLFDCCGVALSSCLVGICGGAHGYRFKVHDSTPFLYLSQLPSGVYTATGVDGFSQSLGLHSILKLSAS